MSGQKTSALPIATSLQAGDKIAMKRESGTAAPDFNVQIDPAVLLSIAPGDFLPAVLQPDTAHLTPIGTILGFDNSTLNDSNFYVFADDVNGGLKFVTATPDGSESTLRNAAVLLTLNSSGALLGVGSEVIEDIPGDYEAFANATPTAVIRKDYLVSYCATAPTSTAKTGAYTLAATDAGHVVPFTATTAATCTIPLHSTVGFPVGTVIEIAQEGAGQITVAGASGVTVQAFGGTKTAGQWASVGLRKKATNTWVVTGGVA